MGIDNLDRLYSHLLEAQDAIYHNRLAGAKMGLLASSGLLVGIKDDYSDVKRMYENINMIRILIGKKVSLCRNEREKMADDIEILIDECNSWIQCVRNAA